GGCKGAVAVAREDADRILVRVHEGQIKAAITPEVPYLKGTRILPGEVTDRRLKSAVAIAQHYDDARASILAYVERCKIELAIAVEIADHRAAWIKSNRRNNRRAETEKRSLLQTFHPGPIATSRG